MNTRPCVEFFSCLRSEAVQWCVAQPQDFLRLSHPCASHGGVAV